MLAVIDKNNCSIISIRNFSKKINDNGRTIFLEGEIKNYFNKDYELKKINEFLFVPRLKENLPILCGQFTILSSLDGKFELCCQDILGIADIFFAEIENFLIISTKIDDLSQYFEKLNVISSDLTFFMQHGYCLPGKTFFNEIRRIPLGHFLIINEFGKIQFINFLDYFKGNSIDYKKFKNILRDTIKFNLLEKGYENEIVLLSGGVDSSVLLGILKDNTEKAKAVTFSYSPRFEINAKDVERSKIIAKKFNVEHEIIEIDIKSLQISQLDEIVLKMPFTAHFSIPFIHTFKHFQNKNYRFWSGQNCDSLYNLGPTEKYSYIHRFLISTPYLKMNKGIYGHKKFLIQKKIVDSIIIAYYYTFYRKRVLIPSDFQELVQFFEQSNQYLALKFAEEKNFLNKLSHQEKTITVREANFFLFDNKLASFFSGRDNKVLFNSADLFKLTCDLPYSQGNMIHLFRNMSKNFTDVLYPKKYLYRFAFEQYGLKKEFNFRISQNYLENESWWDYLINRTSIGFDLRQLGDEKLKRIGFTNTQEKFQYLISNYWFNTVLKKIENSSDVKILC